MLPTISLIEKYFLLGGSLIAAILILMFCWNLVHYIFFGGDDAHRAHAKRSLINLSISLILLLVAWWFCAWLAGYLGF